MGRSWHRGRTALAPLCLLALIAACTSAPTRTPPAAPIATGSAQVVPVPRVLDAATVPGLVPHRDSTNDPTDRRSVATVSVPGQPSLNLDVSLLAHAAVRAYTARLVTGGRNELNVGWDPVLAAGQVLGLRVSTTMINGAQGRYATSSVYTDLHTKQTWTSSDLVADPDRLTRSVAAALHRAGLDAPAGPAQDLRFGADGSLTVVVDTGTGTTNHEAAVRIAADAVAPLLTPTGRDVRARAAAAAAFAGPPAASPPRPPALQAESVAPPTGHPQGPPPPVDCAVLKCIALTFDDGPGPYTEQLLAELHTANVLATFFLVGQNVASLPDVVRAELAAGHYLGNHTWDHRDLSTLTPLAIADEIDRSADAIQDAAGVRPVLLRPPYGATDATVDSLSADRGLAEILWNVDTEDWKTHDGATTTARALAGARPGAIILMHDIQASTVPAVPGIIAALRAAGYSLVTIPQLLGTNLTPGQRYYSA